MYHFAGSTAFFDPDLKRLLAIFAQVFGENYQTKLVGGAKEPLYQPPSTDNAWSYIYFTRDYFSSALHEVAHWCIAGEERRKQVDYGYWYAPDGRSESQQKVFEKVEVAPQALEWIFSKACGVRFRISVDNLQGGFEASKHFREAVWQKVCEFCMEGLPPRAQEFAQALAKEFGQGDPTLVHRYELADI